MREFLTGDQFETHKTDVLVIGSGVAGIMVCTNLDKALKVTLVTKGGMRDCSTNYAQGGVACVLDPKDNVESHIKDTLYAGAGLCDEKVVRVLCEQGPKVIRDIASDVSFDKNSKGEYRLGNEGAHSHNRIIHSGGDATGKALEDGLLARLSRREHVHTLEDLRVITLLKHKGECRGAIAWNTRKNTFMKIQARSVVLASGGYSQLFQETTNPLTSTGDGISLALKAGAKVMDMEFVQFHPTALFVAGAPRFLISEAVRGDGGILRNAAGHAFMQEYDEMGDLAPRDIVSRSIATEMIRTRESCVFLDLSHLDADRVYKRFPNIRSVCHDFGLDIARQWIPVRPAAHYTMGGVQTDEWGCTQVARLYACGEVASNGVHGANRLASNSLLEGLVFGRRVAEFINGHLPSEKEVAIKVPRPPKKPHLVGDLDPHDLLSTLKSLMWRNVGVYRDKAQLEYALHRIREWQDLDFSPPQLSRSWIDFRSLNLVGLAVCVSALKRQESRGAHFRKGYPERDDKHYLKHSVYSLKQLEKVT